MEAQTSQNPFNRRPTNTIKPRATAVKWHKVWVPQDVVATGGKCFVMKWVTDATLKSLREKSNESVAAESKQKPEPTTEVLFLCSYEGCGKTFIDAGALRKHANIHGEKQHACHYPNCGKKFLDSSKLKRHFLIHTGAKDFVCPHEGCGKAFSLDFNLRSHMKTHSQENYHLCPYPGCGKRYAHEYKLKNHIVSYHEKNNLEETPKFTPPEKPPPKTPKSSAVANGSASSDRPYACPYEGCEKAYIHEYKLRIHLTRAHPGHLPDKNAQASNENEMDAGSDQDAYPSQKGDAKKLSRPKANVKLEAAKVVQLKGRSSSKPVNNDNVGRKQWVAEAEVEEGGNEEEDSEETEEERDTLEGRWRYGEHNEEDDDDEETEDED